MLCQLSYGEPEEMFSRDKTKLYIVSHHTVVMNIAPTTLTLASIVDFSDSHAGVQPSFSQSMCERMYH
jgi:hypothetical protein